MEFVEWVGRITGKKIMVQKTNHRPVPLEHWIFHKEKMELIKTKDDVVLKENYHKFMSDINKANLEKKKKKKEKKEELKAKKDDLAKKSNQSARV